jgi:hypothetical protein
MIDPGRNEIIVFVSFDLEKTRMSGVHKLIISPKKCRPKKQ